MSLENMWYAKSSIEYYLSHGTGDRWEGSYVIRIAGKGQSYDKEVKSIHIQIMQTTCQYTIGIEIGKVGAQQMAGGPCQPNFPNQLKYRSIHFYIHRTEGNLENNKKR